MKKKETEVKVSVPENPDITVIDTDIADFVSHAIYVGADKINENTLFVHNDVYYYVMFAKLENENVPVGILVKDLDADEDDVAMPGEDPVRDINVIYPIIPGKEFRGFYILRNCGISIDYNLTSNGRREEDEWLGRIDMNLN